MKILHIFKAYPPVVGGIEHHIRLLAEAQQRCAGDVTVLAASANGHATVSQENGIRVIRTRPWGSVASTPVSPGLARWLRRLRSDVTHLHFPYPFGELAHQTLGRSRATIVTYHCDPVRYPRLGRLYAPMVRRLLHQADRILVTTCQYFANSLPLQAVAGRCCVVPLGIDPRPFAAVESGRVQAIRDGHGPIVLFVGRLRHYKGLDVLFEAAQTVDAEFWIVGAGPMQRVWRQLAARSPAAPRIRFVGQLADEDLPAYYAAADVVVLPSVNRSEAFGLVLLEAMAAGRPVVSTELGTGTSVVNQHGETGLVVPPNDQLALAGALNTLLADPARRGVMGALGRQRVTSKFHVNMMADRTMAIYRDALAGSTVAPAASASD